MPPGGAQEILTLAENPLAKGREHHWFWFSNDVGEVALCDAANLSEFEARLFNPDCFSELSVFGKSGEHWHRVAGRDTIVICGNE